METEPARVHHALTELTGSNWSWALVRSKRDVWIAAVTITSLVDLVVVILVANITPREEWPLDLTLSLLVATALSLIVSVNMARQTLRNHELAREFGHLLERDRLTDVATRDYFFQRMAETPVANGLSLMIDIDHFKAVNDTYGHTAGDAVIRHVAQILRANCRSQDIVCRYGGEEFVVFLFGVGQEDGLKAAERIRKLIATAETRHEDLKLRVTVSIGGSHKDRTERVERAIKEADKALYKAKALGRNRSIMTWLQPTVPV
ncbi:GGDEF domain-containing protein [Tropicimonas sp. TH_r6]|uniref:GGDEF domain-containing protein n=1 Tax=Tropicimonas sp. TH_r6 TaxID=3082085 RepID=UPI002955A31B|nr:GGDEF domain-containing protein [Tropicimonas sp. TH_r6]MDV7144185.1 GGDEF domain-containing protein [Tropicimonas sp. TH_r6]